MIQPSGPMINNASSQSRVSPPTPKPNRGLATTPTVATPPTSVAAPAVVPSAKSPSAGGGELGPLKEEPQPSAGEGNRDNGDSA